MSLLIRYAHIPFYFRFPFAFSTSPIHHYAPSLQCDHMWSHLFVGHMTYNSHVFTSILSVSNQSRVLAPRGQALSIASPYARVVVYHLYLTCLYLPFKRTINYRSPKPVAYMSLPQNWDLALTLRTVPRLFHTISHYFASHCTATIPPSLLATIHLETIPYPQNCTPQHHIGFTLRSPISTDLFGILGISAWLVVPLLLQRWIYQLLERLLNLLTPLLISTAWFALAMIGRHWAEWTTISGPCVCWNGI